MPKINISGEVGFYPNRAEFVQSEIDLSPAGEVVEVVIDSMGGDAFEGMAIHSVLKGCGRTVKTRVGSVAASAASLIFCAGSERIMPEGALLMVHNVSADYACGEGEDLRKTADLLDKLSGEYAKVYAAVSGKSVEEVSALMTAETWMDSTEAVDAGFATAQAVQSASARFVMRETQTRFAASAKRFRNAPASFLNFKQEPPTVMNKELLAKLGLGESATSEQIESAVLAMLEQRDALKAEADAAKAKAKADAESALNAEAEAAVGEVITTGGLAEEDRAATVAAFKADKLGVSRLLAKLKATANPDGHAAPLKLSAQGGAVSAEAFESAVKDAADGEERAALYRAHPAMNPLNGTNATAKSKFIKSSPLTAKALAALK